MSIRHSQLSTHRRATPRRVRLKAARSGGLAEVLGTGWLEWVGAVKLCLQEGQDLSNSREGQECYPTQRDWGCPEHSEISHI